MHERTHTHTNTHTYQEFGRQWKEDAKFEKLVGLYCKPLLEKNKQTEHEKTQMYKSLRNSFLVESIQASSCHYLISQKQEISQKLGSEKPSTEEILYVQTSLILKSINSKLFYLGKNQNFF